MKGEAGIVRDLIAVGVPLQNIWDLVSTRKPYPSAIPVLASWLENLEEWSDPEERQGLEEAIVRSLTVREARKVATPLLIRRFRETPYGDGNRWAIGNALSVVADRSHYDEIVKLITDPRYGTARQMIVDSIGKLKEPRVVPVLIDLLRDGDVAAHAAHALGVLRAKEGRDALMQLAVEGSPLEQREAAKALERISRAEA